MECACVVRISLGLWLKVTGDSKTCKLVAGTGSRHFVQSESVKGPRRTSCAHKEFTVSLESRVDRGRPRLQGRKQTRVCELRRGVPGLWEGSSRNLSIIQTTFQRR